MNVIEIVTKPKRGELLTYRSEPVDGPITSMALLSFAQWVVARCGNVRILRVSVEDAHIHRPLAEQTASLPAVNLR